jgi:hypothetical protein
MVFEPVGQLEPTQEILFDVASTGFHTTLPIAADDIAGDGLNTGATPARRCRTVDLRLSTMTLDGTPKSREGVLVAGEEVLHGLGDGELHEHLPAESQDPDEERKRATSIGYHDVP